MIVKININLTLKRTYVLIEEYSKCFYNDHTRASQTAAQPAVAADQLRCTRWRLNRPVRLRIFNTRIASALGVFRVFNLLPMRTKLVILAQNGE